MHHGVLFYRFIQSFNAESSYAEDNVKIDTYTVSEMQIEKRRVV